ncbi:MAG: helix-turn-helix transcriptional regulator [Desulfotomaculaceae bacterium]|nr:helix-turn-helix transcriptional regulator [Desulfotomaculaceae bacterium]MDD4767544.1 helix-turn-helix transcriptional regulator [Desulfotomaculaceae bacterium]
MMKSGFGRRLRKLRVAKKLTQVELARLCNLGDSTLSFYESGQREPNYAILLRLAEKLNTTPNYLLTGKDIGVDWWGREKGIELDQFISGQPKLRFLGKPLDEAARDDIILVLQTAWKAVKKERAARQLIGK